MAEAADRIEQEAKKAGIGKKDRSVPRSHASLSRWETGNVLIKEVGLQLFARAYGVTPDDLRRPPRISDEPLPRSLAAEVVPIRSESPNEGQTQAKPSTPSESQLAEFARYREQSGWYLAAWRTHKRREVPELAEALGLSPAIVEDLETGARRKNGKRAQNYTPELVEMFAAELGITGGHLIDVNPFTANPASLNLGRRFEALAPEDQQTVIDLAERLGKK